MKQENLLNFNNITYGYPSSTRLVMDGFNLGIGNGTVTAILGPNGAGKTTLLHLALGWLKPQGGIIELDGRPLGGYSRRELGHWMGLVPQNEHVPFEFSLLEYVLLGRAPYLPTLAMPEKIDYDVALDSLKRVGMDSMHNRSILGLSGGELQLVLVARALTQKPRLLLLDEPTSHLDLSNKGRLIQLLHELSAQGVTIILTTHEPDVASALATHLVLVQNGQLLETGTLEQVFTTRSLTRLYRLPINVKEIDGKRVALWN